jgi:hypothetical protein
MTKDEAQRRRWTFYEAVSFDLKIFRSLPLRHTPIPSPWGEGIGFTANFGCHEAGSEKVIAILEREEV